MVEPRQSTESIAKNQKSLFPVPRKVQRNFPHTQTSAIWYFNRHRVGSIFQCVHFQLTPVTTQKAKLNSTHSFSIDILYVLIEKKICSLIECGTK